MNLLFKPEEIKKDIKIITINTELETLKQTKSALFFEIKLTHIETGISVNHDGYDKIKVMNNCLEELNNLVKTQIFINNIPPENITTETKEITNVIK